MSKHIHVFKEITEYFNKDIERSEDMILHIFECTCGFTIVEKKKFLNPNSKKKTMTIFTVVRK